MHSANEGKTILVVEDDPGIAELMKYVLQDAGYEIVICETGQRVFEEVARIRFAAVILDLRIPDMDGQEVAQKLRAGQNTKHLPIIVVSAQRNLPQIARNVGADDYLTKPFNIDDLIAIVEKHTG